MAPNDASDRGSVVFQHYCAICHGTGADGNGRAAKLYDPRPANLRASEATDAYKELIIRRGGLHVGRSGFMPAWEKELTGTETRDVVAYLRSIVAK
jgi:mono/diheme cytochrome c family protein